MLTIDALCLVFNICDLIGCNYLKREANVIEYIRISRPNSVVLRATLNCSGQ